MINELLVLWARFKLLSDTKEYQIGDSAVNPYTNESMSWIKYEDMRREARIQAMIDGSNGSLKRIKHK